MRKKTIPEKLQPILWSCDINQLDLERDKGYIIHQVLIYGAMDDLRWLMRVYNKEELIHVFLHAPYKNYPNYIYFFVKNYLLGLKDVSLDENQYVTSIHGSVRPRTP